MPKNELYKRKPVGQRLRELFFLIALPALARSFVRYFVVTGFVLLFLPRYIPSNDNYMWGVFFLAVFGLWKLFDRLDEGIEDLLRRAKKKCGELR